MERETWNMEHDTLKENLEHGNVDHKVWNIETWKHRIGEHGTWKQNMN